MRYNKTQTEVEQKVLGTRLELRQNTTRSHAERNTTQHHVLTSHQKSQPPKRLIKCIFGMVSGLIY